MREAVGTAVFSSLFQRLQPLNGKYIGECVTLVKRYLNLPPLGNAADYPVNLDFPVLDSVVVLKEGRQGHVALVVGIVGDSIVLAESNRSYDGRILVGRTIPMDDKRIKGYYVPWLV
ncbi:MAG: CHAP domain-containing protein [Candidatus Brocadiales bacterium]|nr:CHAP domain-containing protein [Candidatus Brocadiales bacterium]